MTAKFGEIVNIGLWNTARKCDQIWQNECAIVIWILYTNGIVNSYTDTQNRSLIQEPRAMLSHENCTIQRVFSTPMTLHR